MRPSNLKPALMLFQSPETLVHNAIGRQELTRPQAAVAGLNLCECREGAAAEACNMQELLDSSFMTYTMRVKIYLRLC